METRFKISFEDEANIDSEQMFWWDVLTYMDSWLVLGVVFLEGDEKPRTLIVVGHLRRFSKALGSPLSQF